jgi:hypothetical protein
MRTLLLTIMLLLLAATTQTKADQPVDPVFAWWGPPCSQVLFMATGSAECAIDAEVLTPYTWYAGAIAEALAVNCTFPQMLKAMAFGSATEIYAGATAYDPVNGTVEYDEWVYPDATGISFGPYPAQPC